MKSIQRKLLVATLGLGSLAILLAVIAVALPPPEQTVQLPDGSRLTLEGVTRGKTRFHLLEGGGLGERFLRLLPGSLLERLGAATASLECGDAHKLVLWLSGRGAQDPPSEDKLVVEDEHGCRIPVSLTRTARGAGSWLAGYRLDVLPRRSRQLTLRVRETAQDASSVVAGFVVSLPVLTAPMLEGRLLPAVQSAPEFELTPRAFETGTLEQLAGHPLHPPRDRGWTRLRYDITKQGAPSQEWDLQGIDILDDAGAVFPIRASQSSPSQRLVEASPCLEEAWRVRFALVPHRLAATEVDERWKVQGLTLPVAGTQPLNHSATLRGATVELIDLRIQNGAEPGSRWLWVKVALSGDFPAPAPQLRCQVEGDGLLEEARWNSQTGGPVPEKVTTEFLLELPASVTEVAITLALPRVRVVEIVARPTRAAP